MAPLLGYSFEWRPARARLATAYSVDEIHEKGSASLDAWVATARAELQRGGREPHPAEIVAWLYERIERLRAAPTARAAPLLALVGRDAGKPYRLEDREREVYDVLADLDPEQLAIDAEPLVSFAAEWGFLRGGNEWYSLAPETWAPVSGLIPGCFGERVAGWIFAIRELRDAREIWRAWSEHDKRALRERVEIRERLEVRKRASEQIGEIKRTGDRIAVYLGSPPPRQAERSDLIKLALWSQPFHVPYPRGDLREAAFALLLAMIARRTGAAGMGLEPDSRAPFGVSVVARPKTLLEAAWIQMGAHVLAGDTTRRCAACPRVFTVERTTGPPQEYCGRACIQRAWRQRDSAAKARRGRKRNGRK